MSRPWYVKDSDTDMAQRLAKAEAQRDALAAALGYTVDVLDRLGYQPVSAQDLANFQRNMAAVRAALAQVRS